MLYQTHILWCPYLQDYAYTLKMYRVWCIVQEIHIWGNDPNLIDFYISSSQVCMHATCHWDTYNSKEMYDTLITTHNKVVVVLGRGG